MLAVALRLSAAATVVLPAAAAQPQLAQAETAPHPAQIDRNGVVILIRSTLLALDQANQTGNYTVLRDLGAPGFQQANTAARLGDIFANLRAQKLDLSGVAALDPQLTLLPQIEPNGMMHMTGFFPSVATQINFDLVYAAVDSRWRLFGIAVGLGSSAPVAPAQPPPAAKPDVKVESKPVHHNAASSLPAAPKAKRSRPSERAPAADPATKPDQTSQ